VNGGYWLRICFWHAPVIQPVQIPSDGNGTRLRDYGSVTIEWFIAAVRQDVGRMSVALSAVCWSLAQFSFGG